VRRELESIEILGESDARVRTWGALAAAFAERQPVERPSRRLRIAIAVAVVAAAVAAVLSPPGQAVLDEIREVVGVERAQPALFSLPAQGRLLVASDAGVWVVQEDGSKRLLGPYREAGWSPFGRFVVAARKNELAALELDGDVRWTLSRPGVRFPRWAGTETDTRIAYVDRAGLRVVAGDGTDDRLLAPANDVLIAWRPGTPFVLGQLWASELRQQNVNTTRVIARANAGPAFNQLHFSWSSDGRTALIVHPRELTLVDPARDTIRRVSFRSADVRAAAFSPNGDHIAVLRERELVLVNTQKPRAKQLRLFAGAGPLEGLAWSPDGDWLLVGWPTADQWVFVRADGKRIRAVSNVSEQLRSRSFPQIEGWCCAP